MAPLALALTGIYAALCVLVYVFQDRLIWLPDRSRVSLAPSADVEQLELVTADGVRVVAWLVTDPAGSAQRAPAETPALVFLHGNAGNIADRLGSARTLRDLGLAVMLVEYRGYGGSEGSPSEEGSYLDAVAGHDELTRRGYTAITAYGESLGSAPAIELARRRDVAGLVLEAAFTSIPDLGARLYPWLPVRLLSRVRYDNAAKIGALECPVLLVHSPDDEIVPFEHALELQRRAPAGTGLLRTDGGHNDGGFLRRGEWVAAVGAFLSAASGR